MSTDSKQLAKTVGYEQVKNLAKNIVLVDVREDKELAMTGTLPMSIHVPLGHIEDAFKNLSDEEFKQKYGIVKPKSSDPMIFSCKAGIRSAKAVQIMESLGYKNLGNYEGGWDDWEAHKSK